MALYIHDGLRKQIYYSNLIQTIWLSTPLLQDVNVCSNNVITDKYPKNLISTLYGTFCIFS